jgi:hypothetical protein
MFASARGAPLAFEDEVLLEHVLGARFDDLLAEQRKVESSNAFVERERELLTAGRRQLEIAQHLLAAHHRGGFSSSSNNNNNNNSSRNSIASKSVGGAQGPAAGAKRVRIRVSGHIFETSADVLMREPSSMLAALAEASLSGGGGSGGTAPAAAPREDGCDINVERDWMLFRCVLNFLRDGALPGGRSGSGSGSRGGGGGRHSKRGTGSAGGLGASRSLRGGYGGAFEDDDDDDDFGAGGGGGGGEERWGEDRLSDDDAGEQLPLLARLYNEARFWRLSSLQRAIEERSEAGLRGKGAAGAAGAAGAVGSARRRQQQQQQQQHCGDDARRGSGGVAGIAGAPGRSLVSDPRLTMVAQREAEQTVGARAWWRQRPAWAGASGGGSGSGSGTMRDPVRHSDGGSGRNAFGDSSHALPLDESFWRGGYAKGGDGCARTAVDGLSTWRTGTGVVASTWGGSSTESFWRDGSTRVAVSSR